MSGGRQHHAARGLLVLAAAGGLLAGCGSAASERGAAPASSGAHGVEVTPRVGTPDTSFRVGFTAPASTGSGAGRRRADFVTARGSHAGRGCRYLAGVGAGAVRAGRRVSVVLVPGPRWCPGSFSGRVEMSTRPVCRPGMMCPQFIAVLPIGSFSFVVRRG